MQENGILTQANHERLKRQHWIVGSLGVLATLGMAAAIAIATPEENATPALETVVQKLALDQAQIVSMEGASFLREERIQRGDTLGTLLARLGIQDHRATHFLRTNPSACAIPRQLAPNKTVVAETTAQGELRRLVFPLNGGDSALIVERQG